MRTCNIFSIFMFVLLFCVDLSVWGQTTEKLKSYKGNFKIKNGHVYNEAFGIHGVNPVEHLKGTAEYQYREESDGSRIFEGPFVFSGTGSDCYTAVGQFNVDYQVGTWIWKDGALTVTIKFNDDGDLCEYKLQNFYNGKEILVEILTFNFNGQLLTFPGKEVVTSYKYKSRNQDIEAEFDSFGKPKGKWTILLDGDKYTSTLEFDDNGNIIKAGRRDDTTGDWIKSNGESMLEKINHYIWYAKYDLGHYFLRKTLKKYSKYVQ